MTCSVVVDRPCDWPGTGVMVEADGLSEETGPDCAEEAGTDCRDEELSVSVTAVS